MQKGLILSLIVGVLIFASILLLILWRLGVIFKPTPRPMPTPTPTLLEMTGLWARDPGDLVSDETIYDEGYNYIESDNYCKSQDAQFASLDQLKDAYNKGFEYCRWGWLDGEQAGMSMQVANDYCATEGVHTKTYPTNTKLSTYCYGLVPHTTDVGQSIFF